MRVLITGGAGFVGSHLAEALLQRGDGVFVLDDLSTGSIDNIAQFKTHPRFHYTIDSVGDIYLVGRFGLDTVTESEVDKVLGQILEAADGDFNTLLELGFATSIRKEWDWRVSRGESLANLKAFEHLVRPESPHSPGSLTAD